MANAKRFSYDLSKSLVLTSWLCSEDKGPNFINIWFSTSEAAL
ncbi:unnamed protein product [marine sediment metagenome]|uniref:Uncharacterized protein n=1 Tax=marine sediment metagenome TaxID=412755 RepID=X1TV29_9ZZZZ